MASTKGWIADQKAENFKSRINRIHKINDPTTSADETLFWLKYLIIPLLLVYTGLLAGIAYYKNFAQSFPPEAALVMAVALTACIEYGKNYCAKSSLRAILFRWHEVTNHKASSFLFGAILFACLITFIVSAINSTKGGEQLSLIFAHQRDTTLFVPNTSDIDAQIASAQKNIDDAKATKWKGTTTRKSQEAISTQSAAIASLNDQKSAIIEQQRDDYNRRQAQKFKDNNFAAALMLGNGIWVELLQLIFMVAFVCCEKILDDKNPSPASTEKESRSGGIGFQSGYRVASAEHTPQPPTLEQDTRRPIGFKRYEALPEQPTVPPKITVEQCATEISAGTVAPEQPPKTLSQASVLADVKDWKKRAQQCYQRARTQQRAEYRLDNQHRYTCYVLMLQAVGVTVRTDDTDRLTFEDPADYRIDEIVAGLIAEQQARLARIGTERRVGA